MLFGTLALSLVAWGLEAVGTWLILGGLAEVALTLGRRPSSMPSRPLRGRSPCSPAV